VSARRRITVVLAGAEPRRALLELFEQLIGGGPAEVRGFFVEDHALLRAAELPFVREVCRLTSAMRPLEPRDLERELRVRALAAQRTLERVAARVEAPVSFQRVRGAGSALVGDADLMLLAPNPPALPDRRRGAEQRPVVVGLDEDEASERARLTGSGLAQLQGRPLITVPLADAVTEARARRASILVIRASEPGALWEQARCPVLLVR
jgi:hypothetical protein